LWERQIADYKKGFTATGAPLVVKNKVLVGIAGAEFGTRGFIDAYDAGTGELAWRFYTVAAKGEPGGDTWAGDSWQRGGGSTWITGTYDPDLNLIYWGTGNPGPGMDGDVRAGDNLYTCSLVAIDADTGKLKWHFQFTPHDTHDWDAVADPVLIDLNIKGQAVKAVVQANRNGYFYALDRTSGKFLLASPYTKVNWATGIAADGRPLMVAGLDPSETGTKVCPVWAAGTTVGSVQPRDEALLLGTDDGCEVLPHQAGVSRRAVVSGETDAAVPSEPPTGAIVAVDPKPVKHAGDTI
jgi:alcohol dehydrogenase (cytochrome c)